MEIKIKNKDEGTSGKKAGTSRGMDGAKGDINVSRGKKTLTESFYPLLNAILNDKSSTFSKRFL
jgi:hypothetical protein